MTDIRLQKARVRAMSTHPYLATALMALQPVERPIGTMAVDSGWRLYYDPAQVGKWGIDKAAGVLIHEVAHLLRNHVERRGQRDPRTWNIACDAEINDDLVKEAVLPEEGILPKTLGLKEGLTAEEYYKIIEAQQSTAQQSGEQSPGGDGDGSCGGTGEGDRSAPSAQGRSPSVTAGDCGSCADGVKRKYELPANDADAPGITEAEAKTIARSVARQIEQHNQEKPGSVPGSWRRWASEHLAPSKVPWQQVFAATVRRTAQTAAGVGDYTYTRPSRRGVKGVILPASRRPIPAVSVVADTSGSMSNSDIASILSEIDGICRTVGRVRWIAADAKIQGSGVATNAKGVRLKGGGGTDLRPAIMEADKGADVIVVLTDCYTPWPFKPTRAHMIVCATGGAGISPPWARRIDID
jgi:predicted metal-dependent peptidase